MTATQTAPFQTVAAEQAPIGVLLWPVRAERFAPNFTLVEVLTSRTASGTRVTWIYESGTTRHFDLGEEVTVQFS